jgi:hypothetical protein
MEERCKHGFRTGECASCAEVPPGLPSHVFITTGGDVYHFRRDCIDLVDGQHWVETRGGQPGPILRVPIKHARDVKSGPCAGCTDPGYATRVRARAPADRAPAPGGPPQSAAYSVEDLRRRYPRAYEAWDSNEDDYVLREFERGRTAEELSVVLGRTFGAICARLTHLGVEVPPGPGTAVA